MRKNVASQVVGAQLTNKSDGSPVTAGSTTVYVLGDAGTQATGSVGSGLATHEGNGFWTYQPDQAETNYAHIAFTFVNTAAVTATVQVFTVAEIWAELLEGSLTASDLLRIMAGVAAGKTNIVKTGGSDATVTFRDVSDASDIVVADMHKSNRTTVTVNP